LRNAVITLDAQVEVKLVWQKDDENCFWFVFAKIVSKSIGNDGFQ
jgi:hypothetical protein